MKTRTFQKIYDFCRMDDTYRNYFEASDESHITGARARKYCYGDIRRGQCRVGTFIYRQSVRQLKRFLGGVRQGYYIHVDLSAYQGVSLKDNMFPGQTAHIMVHVRRQDVQIKIEHPLYGGWVHFTIRSHRPFIRKGTMAEVGSYTDSHILLASGRYRDLQLGNMVSKEQFPAWYRLYKMRPHDQAEAERRDMVDRYRHRNDPTYGEARDVLAASGIFFDLNCDEFERSETMGQFVRPYNKTQYPDK